MWFSREQFHICNELKQWGLAPRFEPGDIVARGFADLGHEEFQVLPSSKLLSLTAGTVTALPLDHALHFFWIPSVDEITDLLERRGATCIACRRIDGREWSIEVQYQEEVENQRASSLHYAMLLALASVYKRAFKQG